MIRVFAVPRSIAISCVKKLKRPMLLGKIKRVNDACKVEVNNLN
jgi:hypothetical protein